MRAHKEQSPQNGIDTEIRSKDLLQPELILISAPDDEEQNSERGIIFLTIERTSSCSAVGEGVKKAMLLSERGVL